MCRIQVTSLWAEHGTRTARPTGRPSLCEEARGADASRPQGPKPKHRGFRTPDGVRVNKDSHPTTRYTATVTEISPETPTTMRKRADFLAANRGIRVARPGFVLLAHPNRGAGKRFGVTITKKVGNAVVRNRMKRRFREILRDALPAEGLPDHDHVLIGRDQGIERDFSALRSELTAALDRARAGKGDRRRPRNSGKAPRK